MATGRLPDPNSSPLTAKGDLYTYSTVPAKLAVGSNGETLVADSSASVGLRYTAGTTTLNPVVNSAMDIWQRGTSFSLSASTTTYTADRWCIQTQTNQATTVSRQSTNDTTNLPFIQYCMRVQRNSGQTGTLPILHSQSFETVNSIPFAGRTVTVSYYARKGADYSASGSALVSNLIYGTGTDQNVTGTYTGFAVAGSGTATLTTTWQRFSYQATIPATATEIGFYNQFSPTGTASTNDFFETTGWQIDIGSVALPFRRSAATLAGELQAAQRYYIEYGGDKIFERFGGGSSDALTSGRVITHMPVPMRTTPSMTTTTTDWQLVRPGIAGAAATAITLSSDESSTKIAALTVTIGSTAGFGDSKAVVLCANSSTSARIRLSAEL